MHQTKFGKFVLAPRYYFVTAIASVVFALVGFTYNAWRMEVSEENNNTRTASFQILQELAALEMVVFAAHYDQDETLGNPRKGWVKVNLIHDLSFLAIDDVRLKASDLRSIWRSHWPTLANSNTSEQAISDAIDDVRLEVVSELQRLE